jgi:hypothetical protein
MADRHPDLAALPAPARRTGACVPRCLARGRQTGPSPSNRRESSELSLRVCEEIALARRRRPGGSSPRLPKRSPDGLVGACSRLRAGFVWVARDLSPGCGDRVLCRQPIFSQTLRPPADCSSLAVTYPTQVKEVLRHFAELAKVAGADRGAGPCVRLRPAVRGPVPRPACRAVRLVQVIEPAERRGHAERRAAHRWVVVERAAAPPPVGVGDAAAPSMAPKATRLAGSRECR